MRKVGGIRMRKEAWMPGKGSVAQSSLGGYGWWCQKQQGCPIGSEEP